MPNVMGREFPYTPEGMAAAEQYEQSMGMRDGGMLGFRPIGMARGGVAHPGGAPGGPGFMGASSPLMQLVRNHFGGGTQAQAQALVAGNASVDSGALDSFRREFGREPRDTDELRQYMVSRGGVVTPMRDGGMLGFRPLQMQEGGSPELELVKQMLDLERSATTREVAAFVQANAAALSEVAKTLPQYSKYIGRMLDRFGGPPQVMPTGMSEEDLVGMKQMMPMGQQGMPQEQTPPFYMAPRYPGTASAEMLTPTRIGPDSPRGSDIDYGRRTTGDLNYGSHLLDPETIQRIEAARRNLQQQTGGVPLGYTMGVESARVPGESLVSEFRDGGIASLRRY